MKACNLIADCWNSIPNSTLQNSWNKILRIYLAIQSKLDSFETESSTTSSIILLAARTPGIEDCSVEDIDNWISGRGARTFDFFSKKKIAQNMYGALETSFSDEDYEEIENEELEKEFDDEEFNEQNSLPSNARLLIKLRR